MSSSPHRPQFSVNLNEDEQARRLLAIAVARQASKFVSTAVTNTIRLTDGQLKDGIKNKLIGKEGRNVRFIEEAAGVDLLLNEEPNAIVVSSFDSFRREVARVALEALIKDGRIAPQRIEEALAGAKKKVDADILQRGGAALKELKLENVHPAVIRTLGMMSLKVSYGQNLLDHSVECAQLCRSLALELGFDGNLAARAALFHDLGKVLDPAHEGGHALSAADFLRKYGESEEVAHAVGAHHEELEPQSWLDHLVMAADTLSAARPGARRGALQALAERSQTLEKTARAFEGVTEAYALQAGKELRVFVDCARVDDEGARTLAKQIAERIADDPDVSGQVRVTVLRQMKVTEVAK